MMSVIIACFGDGAKYTFVAGKIAKHLPKVFESPSDIIVPIVPICCSAHETELTASETDELRLPSIFPSKVLDIG